MTKYRVKTEKEFIDEFGQNWRKIVGFNSKGRMDYLLGIELVHYTNFDFDNYFDDYLISRNDNSRCVWSISPNMVKEIITPSYNEKKILIYD